MTPFKITQLEQKYGIEIKRVNKNYIENHIFFKYENAYCTNNRNEITHLRINNADIQQLDYIKDLTQLQYLDLSNNKIIQINGLDKLTQLIRLHLSLNQIIRLEGLDNLTQLKDLDLSYNEIPVIEKLEKLTQLKVLDLSYNKIERIENLDALTQLKWLNLEYNYIFTIENLNCLTKLASLNISANQITTLQGLDNLTDLNELDLSSNSIEVIQGLNNLPNLEFLNLSYNYIPDVSEVEILLHLPKLKNLNAYDNPFLFNEPSLVLNEYSNHLPAIKNYFSLLKAKKIKITLPVKIMLLGNHSSGKSSFLHYLLKKKLPDESIPSTHILDIQVYPQVYRLLPDAVIYDFGGQDYYHGLYQAFFSLDAVNVLLWCNDYDKNQIRIENNIATRDYTKEYWLYQLNYAFQKRRYGNQISSEPVLLVQTHADQTDEKRNYFKDSTHTFDIINEFYISLNKKSLKNNLFRISLEYLKETLLQEIKTKKIEEEKPAYYGDFLNFILSSKEKNAIPLSSLKTHYKREKLPGETEEDIQAYLQADLQQLAFRGMVLYYPESKALSGIVWLNPSETIRYIHSEILSTPLLNEKHGVIASADFDRICTDHPQIKELLLNEKVIFYDKTAGNYIVPSYLPLSSECEDDFDIMAFDFAKPDFILKFNCFIPFGLINQLICLYGNNPDKKRFWRDQLIFTYNKEYKIWIKLDFTYLEIAVHITPKSGNNANNRLKLQEVEKIIFLNIIDLYWGNEIKYLGKGEDGEYRNKPGATEREIREYSRRLPITAPDDMYISLGGAYFSRYKDIEEATEYTHEIISYPLSAGSRKINEHIRKIHPISIYKNFTNNKHIHSMKKIFISYSRKDVEYKNELKQHLNLLRTFDIADTWSCEEITIGKWDDQIQKELEEADLIIYMLSANFFSSKYILEKEIQKGMDDLVKNKEKKILCVIVSNFTGIDKLKTAVEKRNVTHLQDAVLKLAEYQYLPYSREKNNVTGNMEEKIVPLKKYGQIEDAFTQISEKVLEALN